MSSFVNKAVEIGTFGLVEDITGAEATQEAAEQAARLQEEGLREGLGALRSDLAPFRGVGQEAANLLLSNVIDPAAQDPQTILNNPFFQALQQQQEQGTLAQRAALGLAGSGGTQDALARQNLLLGNQFQQQNLQNQQARFNQLFNVAGLGQASAAQTGAAGLNTLGQIGQIQGTPGQVAAQQQAQLTGQLLQLGGTALGSALGGPVGGAVGGTLGGSVVPQSPFFGQSLPSNTRGFFG